MSASKQAQCLAHYGTDSIIGGRGPILSPGSLRDPERKIMKREWKVFGEDHQDQILEFHPTTPIPKAGGQRPHLMLELFVPMWFCW